MTIRKIASEHIEKKRVERLSVFLEELLDQNCSLSRDDIQNSDMPEQDINWILSRAGKKHKNSYTWGVEEIDKKITTPKRGQLFLLVSDENQGKSTFCYFFARENKKKYGHNVYYYNLEQTKEEVIDSMARQYAGITKLEHRDNLHLKNKKYLDRVDELKNQEDINFMGRKANELANIDSVIEYVRKIGDIDYLIIDNLTCMTSNAQDANEDMKQTTMKLISLAEEMMIPIILVHHYRKGELKSGQVFKSTSEIKGSGALKDLVPVVIQVARNNDEDTSAHDEFHIREGKLRGGDKKERVMVRHKSGSFHADKSGITF